MIAGYSVWTVLFICAGVFVASVMDAIGGGGGLITVPVYLMAGLPAHFALGTNKLSSCLGTGMFLLIAFCRLAKMDVRTASGNVKLVNLASNLGALVTSLSAGTVLVPIGMIAAAFAFAGQFLGAGLMIKNGTKIVTPVILTVLTLLTVKIVLELCGIRW